MSRAAEPSDSLRTDTVLSPDRQPSFSSLAFRDSLLCALVLGLCLLLIWPVAEIGVNDDWSYILTTQAFVHTHHFIYNGWATAMLGWQVLWGALFARIFGAGFAAIRLSMVPVALATAMLYHAILRNFSLNRAHAFFGTLVLVLSPLFLALSTTFMSDLPGLTSVLLCIYLCQRALSARLDRHAALWLAAAALTNVLSGTVRQIAWLGFLVMVPACAWLMRRRRYVIPTTIICWIAGVISIKLLVAWFLHHPYSIPETIFFGHLHLKNVRQFFVAAWRSIATVLLFCLPALATALTIYRRKSRSLGLRIGTGLLVLALIVMRLTKPHFFAKFDPPWLSNIVTAGGIFRGVNLFGPFHEMPEILQFLVLLGVVICTAACVEAAVSLRRVEVRPAISHSQQSSWQGMCFLLVPFLAAYFTLLAPRAAFVIMFDRYFLVPIALAVVFVLRWHQDHISARLPIVSYLALAIFAIVAVGGTHDLFAMERARVQLVQELQQAGIPRTSVNAGFEYDAVSQTEAWGYVNDFHLVNPPGAFKPQPITDEGLCGYAYRFYFPAVKPKYVLAWDASPCYGPTQFPAASYHTWLPPATRQLFVGEVLPATQPQQAAR